MMKYIITSPAFGEFRAGEPLAYSLAKRVLEFSNTSVFRTEVLHKGKNAVVTGKGDTVEVLFDGDDKPFVFNVEEV